VTASFEWKLNYHLILSFIIVSNDSLWNYCPCLQLRSVDDIKRAVCARRKASYHVTFLDAVLYSHNCYDDCPRTTVNNREQHQSGVMSKQRKTKHQFVNQQLMRLHLNPRLSLPNSVVHRLLRSGYFLPPPKKTSNSPKMTIISWIVCLQDSFAV